VVDSKKRLEAELRGFVLSGETLGRISRVSVRTGDFDFLSSAQEILKEAIESLEEGVRSLSMSKRELIVRERLLYIGAIRSGTGKYHLHGINMDSQVRGGYLCTSQNLGSYPEHKRFHVPDPVEVGGLEIIDSVCSRCKGTTALEKGELPSKWSLREVQKLLVPVWMRVVGYNDDFPYFPTLHLKHPDENRFLCVEKFSGERFVREPIMRGNWCPDCIKKIKFEDLLRVSQRNRTQR